jgi:hypothetical protein
MCKFSKKLVAWMDGEVGPAEAAALERHFSSCAECRNSVAQYREASEAFASYRDAAVATVFAHRETHRPQRGIWTTVGCAAAIALLLVAVSRHRLKVLPREAGIVVSSSPSAARETPGTDPKTVAEARTRPSQVSATSHSVATRTPKRQHARAADHRRRDTDENASESVKEMSMPAEPSIEVVVPADGMFPPGAMPQGMSYEANVMVRAGSEPSGVGAQLTGFERRRTQP